MELNQERIEAGIVTEVAERITSDSDLRVRVTRAIEERVDQYFAKCADAQIDEAICAAIKDCFDRSYRRTDGFGRQYGEPTTIRKELEQAIAGYWNENVDQQGRKADGYSAKMTRAEWTMTQMVAADFKGEMKQHVVNVAGALKDKLRAELHETVNRLLSETFHVRSADDETRRRSDASLIHPKQNNG